MAARAMPDALAAKDESALIIDLGPHLDAFVADLFGIGAEMEQLLALTLARTRCTRASGCSCSVRR